MSANSHNSAGASNSVSISRGCQVPCIAASAMRARGPVRAGRARRGSVAGEADCPLRVESEVHALTDLEIREPTRLRKGHSKIEAAALLCEQHRGIGAVEQQALHLSGVARMALRQQSSVALQAHDLRS